MRENRCCVIWLFLLSAPLVLSSYRPVKQWEVTDQPLATGWKLQSSAAVKASGNQVSAIAFDDGGWYAARVPGTVLGSLVADSVYRDVFCGRNLTKIPDSLFSVPWLYRKTFSAGSIARTSVV